MSIERNAIIVRGFMIDESPYGKYPDEFCDEWVIDFNSWCGGPYFIGYHIKTCEEGEPIKLKGQMGDSNWDNLLLEACRNAGVESKPLDTYFGVKVS